MVWISLTAMRLERLQQEARRDAALEEQVRIALWRMDAALSPLIAQESVRPYFAYSSFHPAERAYTRMYAELRHGEVLVPSPLLTFDSPLIRLHFQIDPRGTMTSPQVPQGNMRDLAEMGYTDHEAINAAAAQLERLNSRLRYQDLMQAIPARPLLANAETQEAEKPGQERAGKLQAQQLLSNVAELKAREKQVQRQFEQVPQQMSKGQPQAQQAQVSEQEAAPISLRTTYVKEGQLHPMWVNDEFYLVRQVSLNGEEYLQGCWLDWPSMRSLLLTEVEDLFPAADLEPMADVRDPSRLLAALPIRLVPGAPGNEWDYTSSAIRFPLLIALGCVFLATVAVAGLLWGTLVLSGRRATFVSAVTHELRTPLTTFQMYTEMLAKGMVPDEAKRRRYLETLQRESNRLAHLIENVLAFARLERSGHKVRLESISVEAVIDNCRERLVARVGEAGMSLNFDLDGSASSANVRADADAVEQILFNLVDNACKYASSGADHAIQLKATCDGGEVKLRLCDHGPGISHKDARRLFRPFSKSAHEAAHTAPGVGLGLALSRRLARRMHGRLYLDESYTEGACFVLVLPAIHAPD